MKPVVLIPTLNEIDNIPILIKRIIKQDLGCDIIIIDGCSTDGTYEAVEELSARHNNVFLVKQDNKKDGFGKALQLGFEMALKNDYDPIITMDGDNSHDPAYLGKFLEFTPDYGLVIGSRYIDGVRVEGWQFRKLLLSKLANMYISYVLVKPIWDFTSGFRCYRRGFLERIDLSTLHPQAYIVQIQLIYLAYQKRQRVKEIPFIFRDNLPGFSKVSQHSKRKTFLYVLKYRAPVLEIFRHLTYLKKNYNRFTAEYEELINPPELKNQGYFEVKKNYQLSIGVMAYNEEKLIARCLEALQNQNLQTAEIKEIIVISSGSTDRTDEIVQRIAETDNRIRLIIQTRRRGKASAINEFLSVAGGDIVVLESGDTVTMPDTVEELIEPFAGKDVGMSGAHPLPVNDKKTFVGFSVHKLWELHHYLAIENAKCGEMVAFRNIIEKIPNYTAVDEATIEAIITDLDLKLTYSPKAVVYNKGPETLKDFLKQRRRIASGHRHLKATMGHQVATQGPGKILKYVIKSMRLNIKEMIFMAMLIMVEVYSRFMGIMDFYLRDKNPFIWDISKTTKKM